jgi:predicted nucleotidyltransferase/DNA-binding transcriptional regulator YhcF (GntR family)
MEMYKLKWTKLQNQIFSLMCINAGQKFNLRGIAKILKVSPTAVSKAIKELEKENIISIEKSKTMNLTYVQFNRNNERAINLKRAENLRIIYESGLQKFLYDQFSGCTIILFGSYSKGEDVCYGKMDERSSDVDIAIIGTKEKIMNIHEFEEKIKLEISINFFKSWKEIHLNLKNNILNGIILSGSVDLNEDAQ